MKKFLVRFFVLLLILAGAAYLLYPFWAGNGNSTGNIHLREPVVKPAPVSFQTGRKKGKTMQQNPGEKRHYKRNAKESGGWNMKKIMLAVLAAVLLLTAAPVQAQERVGAHYKAVTAAELLTDKIALKNKPAADGDVLCSLYSGAPVNVLDDAVAEGWALVSAGYLMGYIETGSLMRENRNYGAPRDLYTAQVRSFQTALRKQPDDAAQVAGLVTGKVNLLGDAGDGWQYVWSVSGSIYGYIRTADLRDRQVQAEMAYLVPRDGGDRVTVYADSGLETPAGYYFSGLMAKLTAITQEESAAVTCGTTLVTEEPYSVFSGYVRLEDVRVFAQSWEVERKSLKGVAKEDLTVEIADVFVPAGAALTVCGEVNGKYHVIYGSPLAQDYVNWLEDKEKISLTDEQADMQAAPRIGYALLPVTPDEDGWVELVPVMESVGGRSEWGTDMALCELLGEGDNWVQVRQAYQPNFFAEKDGVRIIKKLLHEQETVLGPGEFTADEDTAGLWLLTVEAGKHVEATIEYRYPEEKEDSVVEIIRAAPDGEAEYYTVYVAPGMRVTLTGEGTFTAVTGDNVPVILPEHPADTYTETVIFAGSGRFFCDLQLPEYINWFSYRIRPLDTGKDSMAEIFDLFTWTSPDDQRSGYNFIEWPAGEKTEDAVWGVDLVPGQFLELHNCILEICYGNG